MKLNGIELLNLAVAHELREVWVVRLDPPDQPGNRGPDGELLWPEVLLCKSSNDATHLAKYLRLERERITAISRTTWWRLERSGEVPRRKRVGGSTVWLLSDLLAWMQK